jgi:hypothetical protein
MTTNFVNKELSTGMTATPIAPSDQEQAAIALMRQRSLDDDASLDRRLAAIEEAAARVRAIYDDTEILAKSKMLAAATIRTVERREASL